MIRTRLVPAAPRRTRLLLAALAWTAVGTGLLAAAVPWMASGGRRWLAGGLVAASLLGWAKGRLVLAPRALANARRIEASPERASVLGIFSPPAWALVAVMMAAGALLRRSPIPRPWLGVVYAAVGVALLLAALPVWRRFAQQTS